MIIKVLLIAATVGLVLVTLRDTLPSRHLALRRVAGVVMAVAGVIAVLWPTLTTRVANAIGVQRGTDLVFYTAVMMFIYFAAAMSQRLHLAEHKLRELTRALALAEARGELSPGRGLTTSETRPRQ